MKNCISLLGSTGSIGTQALEVVRSLGLRVCALAAHSNIGLLEEQARELKPQLVAAFDLEAAKTLRIKLKDTPVKVLGGMDGLCEAAACKQSDLVLNSVVGMVGLKPTLSAIAAGKDVALANKETLVTGGQIVMDAVRQRRVQLLPVDSEHSAIFQCLQSAEQREVKKILLTASGGPFFGKKPQDLFSVQPEDALKHPNWNMGAKVTIDSATMMNKGLEMMEAGWLFHVPASMIEVVVHRESIIHSMVEFRDNAVIAQLGVPDMRLPIQYAITYPQRVEGPTPALSLTEVGTLTFYPPDERTFACLRACRIAMERGGLAPAAVNGANEVAVRLFLEHKISFPMIGELVTAAMEAQADAPASTLDEIMAADEAARRFVLERIG